jgi:anti-anti-sigma factor
MSRLARIESEDRDGLRIVHASGEIDLSNAHELMDMITAATPRDASPLVVDLTAIEYLDSAGIAMLFRLAERMRYARQDLRLVVPADAPIRAVVRLTSLHKAVPVDDEIPPHATDPGRSYT